MRPANGERFTWTFQTAKKMLMRFPERPSSASSVTTTTRPSAGETTAPGSEGMTRSGSRKKYKMKAARRKRTAAAQFAFSSSATPPRTKGPAANRYPSLTISIQGRVGALRRDTPLFYDRSEEHTSELQSPCNLVCRLLLEKKKKTKHKY